MRTVNYICALLCAIALFSGCAPKSDEYEPEHESQNGYRKTTLYYESDEGMIVPVMKLIPWEEGIASATLSYLVATADNTAATKAKGLNATVPDGVSFDIEIDEKKNANVNILKFPKLSASAEEKMLISVVNTLTEFSTIDTVTVLLDGKVAAKLPAGTKIKNPLRRYKLNIEEIDVPTSSGGDTFDVTLYYPNKACSLYIPVTRTVGTEPSFQSMLEEYMKGAKSDMLTSCLPEGTKLLDARCENGLAQVYLSKEAAEFENDITGKLAALYDALYLTLEQYDVKELRLYAGDTELEINSQSVSAPLFANEFD